MHKLGENWAEHTTPPRDYVQTHERKTDDKSYLYLRVFLAGFIFGALVCGLLK